MTRRYERFWSTAILLALSAWALAPLVWMALLSVRPVADFYKLPPPFWSPPTGGHYLLACAELDIPRAIGNSLLISVTSVAVTLAVSVPAAFALSKGRLRFSTAILLILLATQMVPGMAALVPIFQIVKELGLMDSRLGVSLVLAARATPLSIWILKGFFDEISEDLVAAALVDGLSPLQVMGKIVLPLTKPGIIAASLFTFMMAWIDFLVPLTLLFDPAKMPFTVQLYQLVGDPITGTNDGALFAAAVIGSAPVVVLFLIFQRHFIRGLTAGGVKG
jgi:multiple sugar transport system permease protein